MPASIQHGRSASHTLRIVCPNEHLSFASIKTTKQSCSRRVNARTATLKPTFDKLQPMGSAGVAKEGGRAEVLMSIGSPKSGTMGWHG